MEKEDEFSLYDYKHQPYRHEDQPKRSSEYTVVTNSHLDFVYMLDSFEFAMISGPEEFLRNAVDIDFFDYYLEELEFWNRYNQEKGLELYNKYDSLGLIIK